MERCGRSLRSWSAICWWRPYLRCAGYAGPCSSRWSGAYVGELRTLFPLFAAYPLLCLAAARRWQPPSLARFGDVSYGMYLYGWPVQQVVRASLGEGARWAAVFAWSAPIALLLGFASWHLVEKRALRLKERSVSARWLGRRVLVPVERAPADPLRPT